MILCVYMTVCFVLWPFDWFKVDCFELFGWCLVCGCAQTSSGWWILVAVDVFRMFTCLWLISCLSVWMLILP